ncbi:hypothetical protein [Dehalobacter sp. 14DCB1]|uniref:hypothetical protein n=1 Tax=Dehalobacter sp. 14DCB1 TaxID=2070227 RepID=UPI0010485CC5|nr:hypothetical protein [Dehalobacter sp. 14DCB1]TCX53616.1 hypothetical protein C1I36_02430 [Dehalobacter sp. 14DCB1]
MNNKTVKQEDYERASLLLGKLFEVETDITDQINTCMGHYGIEGFFKNLETFDFTADVFGKLDAVRMVLFGLGEEVVSKGFIARMIGVKGGLGHEEKL